MTFLLILPQEPVILNGKSGNSHISFGIARNGGSVVKNACSLAGSPAQAPAISLRTIWDVDEDPSYDVHKTHDDNNCLIAIRTLQGAGRLHLDSGQSFELPAETLCVVDRQRIRRYHCHGPRWRFWWFEFLATGALHFPLYTVLGVPPQPADPRDFRAIFTTLRRNNTAQCSMASAAFSLLLHRWITRWEGSQHRLPHQELIERIIDAMSEKLETGWPIRDMARAAAMSERAFRNAFRSVTGQSPKGFYDNLRLSVAAELLKLGNLNVSDVAYRLGFSSPFHFSKAFRKRFGRPPSALRP
jgi:AraC-like DNA-binding protein